MKNIPGLITVAIAFAAIAARRVVVFGADDDHIIQGAAATDALIGVSTDIPAAAGERCDLVRTGITPVEYGGNVTRGALLTSDSVGRAVTAAPGVDATVRVIGVAEVSGVLGDIGAVLIAPSIARGPAA